MCNMNVFNVPVIVQFQVYFFPGTLETNKYKSFTAVKCFTHAHAHAHAHTHTHTHTHARQ